jgi:hypothetical protein
MMNKENRRRSPPSFQHSSALVRVLFKPSRALAGINSARPSKKGRMASHPTLLRVWEKENA